MHTGTGWCFDVRLLFLGACIIPVDITCFLHCAALQAEVRAAHEGSIWAAAWHPAGHLLATGAGDYAVKFWCR